MYASLPAVSKVSVRSRTSIILCADNSFSLYLSIQKKEGDSSKGQRLRRNPSSADISGTGAPRKLVFTPSPAPLLKAVTTFDGSHQGLRPFTAALLVHLGPLTTWILESAPAFAISI